MRTLFLTEKDISDAEYDTWAADYKAAQQSFTNREEMLTEAENRLERDLELIGATAIEDKLQD